MAWLLFLVSFSCVVYYSLASDYTPYLNGVQHGFILYMAWGPLSLIASLVIRNCKHYGFPALAVHGLLGQVILWSSVFSILDKSHLGEFIGLKGYIGIMNLVTLGLIEATAITMSMLKMLHINFNVKCFKFIQLTHMFLGTLGVFISAIAMWIGLGWVRASDPIKGLWFLSYPLYAAIFFTFERGRKKGWCLKKSRPNKNLPTYTVERFEQEFASGKEIMLFDNQVIKLPFQYSYIHPGGKKLIVQTLGKDIGRYFIGGYRYQGQTKIYAHKPQTIEYLKSCRIGVLTNNDQFYSTFYGKEVDSLYTLKFKIISRTQLTPIVSRISFSTDDFSRALYIDDPFYWGKHFKFTTQVPWKKGLKRFVTRYYTFAFSLGEEFLERVDELIIKFKEGGQLSEERWIGEKSVKTIDAFPKLYDYPKAFSRYLHKAALEKNSEFEIEGPMGFGLRLNKGANGTHVAITAGTGIVPFLDIVFYLLRRGIYEIGKKQGRSLEIFKGEFERKPLDDGFKLILFASFSKEEEVIALKYIRLLEEIEMEHKLDSFKFFLRISGDSLRWDQTYFEKWIPRDIEKVWVRGPEKFNFSVNQMLRNLGYAQQKILET